MSDYSKIELFISGRQLKDKDVFSKSDPFVKITLCDNGHWVNVGRTETIQNQLNPNFQKSFQIDYIFEVKQLIKFEVRDDDGSSSDFLGSVETTVGTLFGAKNQTSILSLGQGNGKLIVRCDKIQEGNTFLTMKWSGVKLMNTDGWFGTSDPFLKFLREREDGTFVPVHQTEVVMNNLNPSWKLFEIKSAKLSHSNDRKIKIECWDWEKNEKFQFIGETYTNLDEIGFKKEFPLSNPKHKHCGTLKLEQFASQIRPGFMDYIRGGLQLNLVMAIDFTGSNGNPNQGNSLHYRNPNQPNQYQQAIMSVGEILLAYDYDKLVPCFGFGAVPSYPYLRSNQVMHCFPLSGNPTQTEAFGVGQILEQYNYAVSQVQFSGPTYFGPIIQETMKITSDHKAKGLDVYSILLILTDGEIHDMELTKELIVDSSRLPYSIIIVGVGNADFANMEVLDGDDGLYAKGRRAERDLVQFVPFRQFHGNQIQLAKHVLAEIPEQVVKYHQIIGKPPNAPLMVDVDKMGYTVAQSMQPQQQQLPPQQMQQQQMPPQPTSQYPQFQPTEQFNAPPQKMGMSHQPPQGYPPQGYPPQGYPPMGMSHQQPGQQYPGVPLQPNSQYGYQQQQGQNNNNIGNPMG